MEFVERVQCSLVVFRFIYCSDLLIAITTNFTCNHNKNSSSLFDSHYYRQSTSQQINHNVLTTLLKDLWAAKYENQQTMKYYANTIPKLYSNIRSLINSTANYLYNEFGEYWNFSISIRTHFHLARCTMTGRHRTMWRWKDLPE